MVYPVCLSVCALNQWALDFTGNLDRIIDSVQRAKASGSKLILCSELCIPGYGCEDHFMELDTYEHCWQMAKEIIVRSAADLREIVIIIGMPVMHRNTGFNCELAILSGHLLLIRPKMAMCDGENYRESRWFCSWKKQKQIDDHVVPPFIQQVLADGKRSVPFGDAVLQSLDNVSIGFETCEELWATKSTFADLALDGVEIVCNASASHHKLQKLQFRVNQFVAQGEKFGGVYMYSNQRGCDGGRLYYDGNPLLYVNGQNLAHGIEFNLSSVEVVSSTVDIDAVRMLRNELRESRRQATTSASYPRLQVNITMRADSHYLTDPTNTFKLPTIDQEIAFGPACWLWDYLRRSSLNGFFLPLSGGKDSAAVACLVYHMCVLVCQAIDNGSEEVLNDVRRIVQDESMQSFQPNQLCSYLLHTTYLGTENSSGKTRLLATNLTQEIGASHANVVIDSVVQSITALFLKVTGRSLRYSVQGGSARENLALQNIQARTRMLLSYLFAQLSLWVKGKNGSLLVLGTSNVDECLRGYLTKYDCSSADINPIGALSKMDLQRLLAFCSETLGLKSVDDIMQCEPTAELTPLSDSGAITQNDEQEMGMSYSELSLYGRLRKMHRAGPYTMFMLLLTEWRDKHKPNHIARKVKHFFRCYAINRHKATVATPAYHAQSYSPDDHRFDLRPFLYNVAWTWQFQQIDRKVAQLSSSKMPST